MTEDIILVGSVFDEFSVELDRKQKQFIFYLFVPKMKELTLLLCVCLCAAVRGSIKCSYVVHLNSCWNPTTYERDVQCFTCSLPQRSVFTSPITVFGIFLKLIPTRKPWNVQKINIFPYTDKDYRRENVCVDILSFHKSSVTKMPVIIEELFNSTVTEVRLIDTDTKVINAEFFGDNINLRTLEIAENEGLTLEGLAFANCSSLVSLHFDNNNLESLPFDAFHGMQQLVRLDLWTEGLTVLEPVWFKDLVSLKVLDLRENQLQEIPEEAFDALLELERLYLSKNKIEFITGRIFKHNVKLQTLKLSQNMIKKIQVDSFQQLSNLKWLELMGNNCTNNTFTDQNFTEIAEGLTPCYPITCIIPVIPNGFVITVEDNSTILPGDSIEELMPVKVRCNSTFLLFHDKANQTENACLASGWQDPEWPQCKS